MKGTFFPSWSPGPPFGPASLVPAHLSVFPSRLVFSGWVDPAPQGTLRNVWSHFQVVTPEAAVHWYQAGGAGVSLSALRCKGGPTRKNDPAPTAMVPRLGNPA